MTWIARITSLAPWSKLRPSDETLADPGVRIIASCLETHAVTSELSVQDRLRLATMMRWETYEPAQALVQEGDDHDDRLFLIDAGTVRVERASGSSGAGAHHLARLDARCCVGEVSFLSGRPRMASVVAETPVRALTLSRARVDEGLATNDRLHRQLLDILRLPAVDKLAHANDHAMGEAEMRVRFGHFIVLVMILLVIQNFLTGASEQILARVPIYVFSMGGIGFAALTGILLVPRIVGQPLTTFGLSAARWRRGVLEGLALGVLGWALASLAFPRVDFGEFLLGYVFSPLAALYMLSVFLQELVFRGMFVTALQVFFRDERGLRSVVLSSLVFSSMHVPFGWALTAVTFVGGLVFGLVYLRHRTLVGVCVVHFILGSLGVGVQLVP